MAIAAKNLNTPIVTQLEKKARKPREVIISKRVSVDPGDLDVLSQIRLTFSTKHALGAVVGCVLGSFVPFASFWLGHEEIRLANMFSMVWDAKAILVAVLVCGGLVFSAKTVYDWARRAFHNGSKALGFTVLLEGVMLFANTMELSIVALVLLMSMNGIGTSVNLVCKKPEKEWELG